jgi:hypothetical protein
MAARRARWQTPAEAARKGIAFFQQLLCDDGHVGGDYGGPMFLMPGLIISCHCTGVPLGARAGAMATYLRNHQQADGGWGTHIESPSTMFGTVLSYVSLRLPPRRARGSRGSARRVARRSRRRGPSSG